MKRFGSAWFAPPPWLSFGLDWVGEDWIVPIDFTIGKLVMAGKQPISLTLGARYWATAPDNGPEGWGLRAVVSFVFPK